VAVTELSASWGTVFALGSDGQVYAWGDNSFGQLAVGSTDAGATPVPVPMPPGVRITDVDAGYWHALALSASGEVYAWGDNSRGQLGVVAADEADEADEADGPVALRVGGGQTVTHVSGGGMHSLALTLSGEVYAWGDNSYGQLGDGTTNARPTPLAVRLPSGVVFVQVAALANSSLALAADGRVYAWGDNAFGQLGDGTTVPRLLPVQALLPSKVEIRQISGGSVHALALDADGGLYTWGHSHSAHRGASVLGDRSVPVRVWAPTRTAFAQVSAGFAHSAGVSSDGRLLSWGADWAGQLAGEMLPVRAAPETVKDAVVKDATVLPLAARADAADSAESGVREASRWVYVGHEVKATAS
jgi:alpha-tubulin suppressor-like RCC1 family protein